MAQKYDSEAQRKKKVLNILLLGTVVTDFCIILINFIFLIIGTSLGQINQMLNTLILAIIALFGGVIIFLFNNYLSNKIANSFYLIFVIILIYLSDTPFELIAGRSLLLLVIPIILSGFLLKPYASFITSIFIIIINLFVCLIKGFSPNFTSIMVLILIAFITWFSTMNFEKFIKKYQEGYKLERFYKDLIIHDTSNIFQNILTGLEILQHKLENSIEFAEINHLILIKYQIERGANLIRNVRIFSKFSESREFVKKMDLKETLEKAIKNVKLRSNGRIVNIQVESSIQNTFVMANKFLLAALENILMNSIIYNENSFVKIFIRLTQIQEDKVKFLNVEFTDNGVGIPDSNKKAIFKREINGNNSLTGLGLGLPLVKRILDQYNATIRVENKVPDDHTQGNKFIIVFPKA
ncbi:MAG: sensor histidine kinase [Promethearchaeota archaeon]